MRKHPLLYEINTWVWLADLTARYGTPITLANVPRAELDQIAMYGFDAVWLMGVWERSPAARQIGLHHEGLQKEYAHALPDGFTAADVAGSPYAVHRYTVDAHLGGRAALATFRGELKARGLALFLDYVPNHVALDHPWTREAPDVLVRGNAAELAAKPNNYFRTEEGRIFAHGGDPYFPAWTDTVQIDAFSRVARQTTIETLRDIAGQCDGVRCDMAMLLVSRVFAKTWARDEKQSDTEFWRTVIPAVRAKYPDFCFMAEVYWDMESELIGQGFDYCYDKRLYDRLKTEGAAEVRDHLLANLDYQSHMVRFTENHDEARAVTAFEDRLRAAAVLSTLLPGLSLYHEGQLEGRRRKLPVQLGRRSNEPLDQSLLAFYRTLLKESSDPVYHDGTYFSLAAKPLLGHDNGNQQMIAFGWSFGETWRAVVANLASQRAGARITLPNPGWAGVTLRFTDQLSGTTFTMNGDDLLTNGFSVDLPGWGVAVWAVGRG